MSVLKAQPQRISNMHLPVYRPVIVSSPCILGPSFLNTFKKCQSRLQQTTNFATSFLIFEKNKV